MLELKEAGLGRVTGLEIAQAFGALAIEQYSLSQHEDILRRLVTHFKHGGAGVGHKRAGRYPTPPCTGAVVEWHPQAVNCPDCGAENGA